MVVASREPTVSKRGWLWFPEGGGVALPGCVIEVDLGGGYSLCYLDGERIAYRYRHGNGQCSFGYYLPPDSPYLPAKN